MLSLNPIWTMPRPAKRLVSVVVDIIFIFIAFWGAFYSRMGSIAKYWGDPDYWYVFAAVALVTLVIFTNTGLYRAVLRYLSLQAVVTVAFGAALSGLSIVLFSYYFQIFLPRSVPVIYATFFGFDVWWSTIIGALFSGRFIGEGSHPCAHLWSR